MRKNELCPLDELRQEKEIVRKEVAESEERLAVHWEHLSDNAPSLIINAAINGVAGWFGFGHKKATKQQSEEDSGSNSLMHNLFGGLTTYYPLIWEIVQPMLFRYAVKKIKSLFTRKKRKD